ncbi:hypothetical protein MESS2_1230010 [Mesorhizobium metallidurans STM 2683]|uniref:Uncharacterized protein n=1 Tax=Mesorhizobium metallidurans STM 2683 TaxID=1297569 RepID=M5EHW4_9HYPH|nr:hypothetical protein MESS2_1230010 [Mesorhizobium metallidurans STM 2683]
MLDQVLDRAGDVFDWHIRIDPVLLVEQIDTVCLEAFQRCLSHLFDMLRPTVEPYCPVNRKTELAGDGDLVTERRERLADELFACIGAVNLGGRLLRHSAADAGGCNLPLRHFCHRSVPIGLSTTSDIDPVFSLSLMYRPLRDLAGNQGKTRNVAGHFQWSARRTCAWPCGWQTTRYSRRALTSDLGGGRRPANMY